MFNGWDNIEDWRVADQTPKDPYPKMFTSYTQAVEELDKDPTLIIQSVNNVDERMGEVMVLYMVSRVQKERF